MEVRILSLFFVSLLCAVCQAKKLVVILVDGVRWDYLDDPDLKGFRRMAEKGVRASKAVPVFPSLSYPNWGSLVTGLYPENQGFVDNFLYDKDTRMFFNMVPEKNSTNPIWWNDAEPIWITAEKNKMPAALYWWAGCDVEIMGSHPTICERHRFGPKTEEEKIDFLERIDDLINLFKPSKQFPDDRMTLAMMYYGPVDYAGHHFGPSSKETKEAMKEIDDILDQMQEKFGKAGLENEVNIMVISDHGMTDVSSAKYIELDQFSPSIQYQVSYGPVSSILPKDGMTEKLYQDLLRTKIAGLQVYKKEDIPEEYHIKKNRRTTPIFLEAKPGYIISQLKDTKKISSTPGSYVYVGHHGYNPKDVPDMKTVFLATGPSFKPGFKIEEAYNIDVYNVMCSVLGILPLDNNGSWSRIQDIMMNQDDPQTTSAISSAGKIEWTTRYLLLSISCLLMSRWAAKLL